MQFTHLGQKNEIGANSYLLEFERSRVLLDAGMSPKEEGANAIPRFDLLEFGTIDTILLSHSHLDHVGSIPIAMRNHPGAPVYMSPETMKIADAMLHNSVNVMTHKREELGMTEYPFFTHREVDRLSGQWQSRECRKQFQCADTEVECTFYDAGHIMGSVGMHIEGGGHSIFYTGDVNFKDQTLMMAADFPEDIPIDTLILETTRGDTQHPIGFTRAGETLRLAKAVKDCYERGGSVLIPIFALGKTQELLVMLDLLKAEGLIPDMPVMIGGLSTKMTAIFDRFSHESRRQHPGLKILEDLDITTASRRRGFKDITYSPGMVYALSSGMMTENTISNKFAPRILGDARNAILFVGYAAEDTPARTIIEAEPGDMIALDSTEANPVELNCHVDHFDFSGHASREDLRAYANRLRPSNVILVHGDPAAMAWFQKTLSVDLPDSNIIIPKAGEAVELNGNA